MYSHRPVEVQTAKPMSKSSRRVGVFHIQSNIERLSCIHRYDAHLISRKIICVSGPPFDCCKLSRSEPEIRWLRRKMHRNYLKPYIFVGRARSSVIRK
ncbi:unnamed protein product [Allacma fusca]|uniref:Uncharacterized protein n=1 Tax=Allacma fusca TaxID=39272 RepID=A0A8J2JC25_9HEXA|nr:unnamed protein product [Allacma fusca]